MTETDIPKESPQPKELFLPDNVALAIFFSSHARRQNLGDFQFFKKKLVGSDIFIPEIFSWTPKDLNSYRQISQGNSAALKEYKDFKEKNSGPQDFGLGLAEALYNSRVKVAMIDTPRDSIEEQKLNQARKIGNVFSGNFEEALEFLEEYYSKFAIAQRDREDFMLGEIGSTITNIIQAYPKLKNKSQVNVLMTLGANHTYILDRLNEVVLDHRNKNGSSLPSVEKLYGQTIGDLSLPIMQGLENGEDVRGLLIKKLASMILEGNLRDGKKIDAVDALEFAKQLGDEDVKSLFLQFKDLRSGQKSS